MGAGTAFAGKLDFTLVNKTGVDIHEIYLSPSDQDEWGPDVLGEEDILENGTKADITFSPKADADLWDLMIKDEDGNEIVWEELDLTEIEILTLTYNNKKPGHEEEGEEEEEEEEEK